MHINGRRSLALLCSHLFPTITTICYSSLCINKINILTEQDTQCMQNTKSRIGQDELNFIISVTDICGKTGRFFIGCFNYWNVNQGNCQDQRLEAGFSIYFACWLNTTYYTVITLPPFLELTVDFYILHNKIRAPYESSGSKLPFHPETSPAASVLYLMPS